VRAIRDSGQLIDIFSPIPNSKRRKTISRNIFISSYGLVLVPWESDLFEQVIANPSAWNFLPRDLRQKKNVAVIQQTPTLPEKGEFDAACYRYL
jgi:hypothetical protein